MSGPVASTPDRPRPPCTRSVIIPMYRERDRIRTTLRQLAGSVLDRQDTELLLVDDGSDDHTADVAAESGERLGLRLRVLRLPHQGKGAAVAAGMLAARGDALAFTDADLSTGVADIVACLQAVERDQADLVVATRAHPDSRVTARGSRLRKVSGWSFNYAVRALGLTTLRDTQCGLKGFNRDSARTLFAALRTPGFAFDIELLARADRLGLRVAELPVTWSHVPASRVRITRDATRMLLDAFQIRRALASIAGEPTPGLDPVLVDLTALGEESVAPPLVAELSGR